MINEKGQFVKGNIPFNKGKKGLLVQTEIAKKMISQKLKGIKRPPRTEEHKRKISLARKGIATNTGMHWKLSTQARKNISNGHKGEKSYSWKGGITPINKKIRNSLEYRLWRESVFTRDGYTCIWCGAKNGDGKTIILHADHIKPFCNYPELRFAIDNGRTLCILCHHKTDTYGGLSK